MTGALRRAAILRRLTARRADRRLGVKLALWGAAARDALRPESDSDIPVDCEGPATFDRSMDLKFWLEEVPGRPVDLVTVGALKPRLRATVEGEAISVA